MHSNIQGTILRLKLIRNDFLTNMEMVHILEHDAFVSHDIVISKILAYLQISCFIIIILIFIGY